MERDQEECFYLPTLSVAEYYKTRMVHKLNRSKENSCGETDSRKPKFRDKNLYTYSMGSGLLSNPDFQVEKLERVSDMKRVK